MTSLRGSRRTRHCVVGFILLLSATACHSYIPIADPQPGTTVRVTVPVTSAAQNRNAPPQYRSIEGDVVEAGDTVVLAVRTRQEYGAFREIVRYDTLRLAPDQRYSMERSEFSTARTALLTAVITGGITIFALAAVGGGGGGDGPIDPGPPPPQPSIVVGSSLISGVLGWLGGGGR